jgi:hypothetical protein
VIARELLGADSCQRLPQKVRAIVGRNRNGDFGKHGEEKKKDGKEETLGAKKKRGGKEERRNGAAEKRNDGRKKKEADGARTMAPGMGSRRCFAGSFSWAG